jgi:hypothetical protein
LFTLVRFSTPRGYAAPPDASLTNPRNPRNPWIRKRRAHTQG